MRANTRHENILAALDSIAGILSRHTGQRRMLEDVLGVLEAKLRMQRGTIMLLSPDGTDLVVEAAPDVESARGKSVRYEKGEGITGRVLQSGEAAVIPRISGEPQFRNRIHRRGEKAGRQLSFICVPVASGNEVVGTLSVDIPREAVEDLEDEKRVLAIVAGMIAGDVQARRTAAMQRRSYEAENLRLRSELGERLRPENIIGNSHPMQEVYRMIHQVAGADATVLIRGESGTGKELVASAIHYRSERRDRPLVKVNCAALSEALIESELFGHEKGAFTGATRTRRGRIEEAEGGTLFLDEIGDFSSTVQVKLLRVLQEKEYQRVGSGQTRNADVRIIAATNRDLEEAVEDGEFREDLYYRINVVPIFLPPLRKRKGDVLLLADHFVEKYAGDTDNSSGRISTEAINMMMAYHWPGNVRELENCIERAVVLSPDGVIHAHHLPPTLQLPDAETDEPVGSLEARTRALERDMIIDALKRSDGNMAAAGRDLDITPRQIRYKISNLGIDPEVFRRASSGGEA